LKDKDEEVRIKAMEALTKVGEPAIPAMIAALGAPDALVRRGASDTLAKIGEGAVPALTHSLLDNDDRHVRIEAVESLGKMGHERAVPPLVLALMDPDGDIQEMAAQALVSTGKPAVMPLVRVLRVAGNPVRARVIEVLLRIRGLAVKPLVELLGDQNPEVRLAVSETLVKIGRPALRPLKHALRSASPAVRLEAAAAIGMIGDPAAVLPLIRAATGKDRELRQKAFEALVRIGKPAAAPLAALFKDADTTVREQAAQALLEIGRPSFEALCCALYEVDFSSRWEAARVLSRLRSSGHLRGLHGQWERIVEETLLQAWFSSGWAQRRAERAGSSGDSKGAETTARLTQCLPPGRGDRGLGESRNIS
ncbi:MAG: HEAT repeat domain-containing protein, partial [Dehalococcoidia bacterium]|nr:HEAT repeat domain-containing protein [Dehalococcoidia bacterium]